MASRRFVKDLRNEVPRLVADGLVTEEQGARLLARYAAQDEGRNVASIVATFGAILIGLGILTLVALNWDAIPALVRVLLLFGATLGAYHAGYELRNHRSFPKVGSALAFLGAILVGVSIVLVGQIYNLHSSAGHWLLLWTVAIVPVAYALESASILALGLLTFAYWFGAQFGRVATLGAPHRWWSDDALFTLFSVWPLTVAVFLSLGILYWAIGTLHETRGWSRGFARTYRGFGVFFLLFNAYMLTFRWFHGYFWTAEEFASINPMAFGVIWTVAAVSVIVFLISSVRQRDRREIWTAIALSFFMVLAIVSVSFPQVRPSDYYEYPYGRPYELFTPLSLLMNVLFLALVVGAGWLGLARHERYLINLAILFFAVDVISRYVEFFRDRLSGGVFFIVTGAVLIVLAFSLEKARRRFLTKMEPITARNTAARG